MLVTGGNWLGPIKKFNLTVEKPSEKALVGIKRASPTTFTVSADNYAPDSDLNVLFVEPMPPS